MDNKIDKINKPLIVSLEGQSWVESPIDFKLEDVINDFKDKVGTTSIVFGDSIEFNGTVKSECFLFKNIAIHAILFPDNYEVRVWGGSYHVSKAFEGSYENIKCLLK